MDLEERWKRFQKHQGYTDEELAILRSKPKYVKMVERTPQYVTHKIIAEVISSRNCHSQLKVGDKIVMNGNGQVLRDECPEKMCIWALEPLAALVNVIYERFAEDLDPNDLVVDRVTCQDVGVECGGFGQVMLRIYAEGPEGKK